MIDGHVATEADGEINRLEHGLHSPGREAGFPAVQRPQQQPHPHPDGECASGSDAPADRHRLLDAGLDRNAGQAHRLNAAFRVPRSISVPVNAFLIPPVSEYLAALVASLARMREARRSSSVAIIPPPKVVTSLSTLKLKIDARPNVPTI